MGETPVGQAGKAEPGEPDDWNVDVTVVLGDAASTDDLAEAATATRRAVLDSMGGVPWTAHVTQADVQVELVPQVLTSAAADARAAREVADLPQVERVATARGWAYVTATDVASAGPVLAAVRGTDLWADGGDLSDPDGRLKITDVPSMVTPAVVQAVIEAGVRHPDADFALEGRQGPALYANHLTAAEGAALVTAFTQPELGREQMPGFVPDFFLRVQDGSSTKDLAGTFGQPD